MAKSKQEICLELEAINTALKTPVSYSEDDPIGELRAKLKAANDKLNAEPKPVKKDRPEHVSLGKGNDEYGRAINKLIDAMQNA